MEFLRASHCLQVLKDSNPPNASPLDRMSSPDAKRRKVSSLLGNTMGVTPSYNNNSSIPPISVGELPSATNPQKHGKRGGHRPRPNAYSTHQPPNSIPIPLAPSADANPLFRGPRIGGTADMGGPHHMASLRIHLTSLPGGPATGDLAYAALQAMRGLNRAIQIPGTVIAARHDTGTHSVVDLVNCPAISAAHLADALISHSNVGGDLYKPCGPHLPPSGYLNMAHIYDGMPTRPCEYRGCLCCSLATHVRCRTDNTTIASTLAHCIPFLFPAPLNGGSA
ncbi:hypothetical protein DL93DRAFT_2233900 [Clavulina sp. PMI_390]|nr:hypothetical protein DL93DRAFT_2233900 [Clavulina sp. PMI_390]